MEKTKKQPMDTEATAGNQGQREEVIQGPDLENLAQKDFLPI